MEGKRKRGLSICTVDYYSATAGNEVLAQAATCKNLEHLMLSAIRQSHEDEACVSPHTAGTERSEKPQKHKAEGGNQGPRPRKWRVSVQWGQSSSLG